MQECCISHDILTNLDLDNNEVEESKSVAHLMTDLQIMLVPDNMLRALGRGGRR